MTRFKNIFVALLIIVAAGVLASLLTRNRMEAKSRENDAVLRQRADDLLKLVAENNWLSNLVAQANSGASSVSSEAASAEVARLRAAAEALRQQSNTLALQLAQSRRAAGAAALSRGDYNLLDHNLGKSITFAGGPRETGKLNDARAFAAGLRQYADDHDGQFASDLSQLSGYLPKPLESNALPWINAPVTGTNDFEIVFQGSQNDLSNIPLRRVLLIRERQPWQTPEGKWAKVYGYADGAAEIVESDDNFQSWEAQQIVPSASATQ